MGIATPQSVLKFWIDEIGPKGWYNGGEALDVDIRARFLPTWEAAHRGELHGWCSEAEDTLAFLVVADQFPRNMFRNDERAYATDMLARSAAKRAVDRRWDMRIPEPQRQFFYMPLVHSENLVDQDRAVRLFAARMPESGEGFLPHARAHREIVRRYGRFPFRNEALRRMTLPTEVAFLESGGYGAVLRSLQA